MRPIRWLLLLTFLLFVYVETFALATKIPDESVLSNLSTPQSLHVPAEGCLVWQKPIYTSKPGIGYRLLLENGQADGSKRVDRWQVFIDGSPCSSGLGTSSASEKKVCPIRLLARTELCLVLEGKADSFVRYWIEGEAIPKAKQTITRPDGSSYVVSGEALQAPMALLGVAQAVYTQQPASTASLPKVDFIADRNAISIGQMSTLHWHVQDSSRIVLYLPYPVKIPASGRAQVFAEGDTTLKIRAEGNRPVEKEILLQVAVPEPELAVELTPSSIDRGGEAVLSWKSRNARMVHFLGSPPDSALPLSGSLVVKDCPQRGIRVSCPIILEAVSGPRKVTRSVSLEVIDREAQDRQERELAELEVRQSVIDPVDEQTVRTCWQAFCKAMINTDSEAAAAYIYPQLRDAFRKKFSMIHSRFTTRNWQSLTLHFGRQIEDTAIFVLGPAQPRGGEDFHDEDVVYFKRDPQNNWWLCW